MAERPLLTPNAAKFLAIIALVDGAFATIVALFPIYLVVSLFFAGSALALGWFVRRLLDPESESYRYTILAKKEAYVAIFICLIWLIYFALFR